MGQDFKISIINPCTHDCKHLLSAKYDGEDDGHLPLQKMLRKRVSPVRWVLLWWEDSLLDRARWALPMRHFEDESYQRRSLSSLERDWMRFPSYFELHIRMNFFMARYLPRFRFDVGMATLFPSYIHLKTTATVCLHHPSEVEYLSQLLHEVRST